MAVQGVIAAGADIGELDIRLDEQKREDYVADAARQPDGKKQHDEHPQANLKRKRRLHVHEYVRRGRPGADEDMPGVRTFCPRNKEGDNHAQYSRRGHDIPVLDEADMNLVMVLVVIVLAGVFGEVLLIFALVAVYGGMCGDGDAHDAFAEEGDDRVAQRRHTDGADEADDEDQQEIAPPCMEAKERGGYHRAQQDVGGVKNAEHHLGRGFGDVLEEQHESQTEDRSNRGERSVALQFGADMFDLLNYRHLTISKRIVYLGLV